MYGLGFCAYLMLFWCLTAACTCPGESHPGPMRPDGSYVGRAAPEIDVLEATVTDGIGYVSERFLCFDTSIGLITRTQVSLSVQFAPFNVYFISCLGENSDIWYFCRLDIVSSKITPPQSSTIRIEQSWTHIEEVRLTESFALRA